MSAPPFSSDMCAASPHSGTSTIEIGERPSRNLLCFGGVVLGVLGFNANKEAVLAGKRKLRRVENRMVRLREPVQSSMLSTAPNEAPSTINSNVIGINAGQLSGGRPPIFQR